MIWHNLNLRTRILLGYGLILLLTSTLALFFVLRVNALNQQIQQLNTSVTLEATISFQLATQVATTQQAVGRYLQQPQPEYLEIARGSLQTLTDEITQAGPRLGASSTQQLAALQGELDQYRTTFESLSALITDQEPIRGQLAIHQVRANILLNGTIGGLLGSNAADQDLSDNLGQAQSSLQQAGIWLARLTSEQEESHGRNALAELDKAQLLITRQIASPDTANGISLSNTRREIVLVADQALRLTKNVLRLRDERDILLNQQGGMLKQQVDSIAQDTLNQLTSATADLEQQTHQMEQLAAFAVGITLLLALLLGIQLAQTIARPVKELVSATARLNQGDYDVTVSEGGGKEIRQLAMAFKHMAQTLGQQRTELMYQKEVAEQARQVAEDANQMKTRFLANMSHELRTPLNAVINFSQLALTNEKRNGTLSDRQRLFFQRIQYNGEHLLGLINDILDLAKIEAGHVTLIPEPIALRPLLDGVMSTALGLTKNKPIRLNLQTEEVLPTVVADKTRLRQILLNLLSNAVKFTETGDVIVHVQPAANGMLAFGVQDSGIGIAPEHQGLVFEEFRQVEDERTRSKGGTGLGLPISKRLVEMHGGTMWLESQVDVGSTFWFTLPVLIEEPQELADPEPIAASTNERALIVVVDDDAHHVTMVGQWLEAAGYSVHGISDSRLALDTIRQLQPQLVILDLIMPTVDGLELLGQLRTDNLTRELPVIVCSIAGQEDISIAIGANDYLCKPIQPHDLLPLVARWTPPKARIVIVDDDQDARMVLRAMLEGQYYEVHEASNGMSGLTLTTEVHPDLIVLDLMMPEMDGFSVLAALRENTTTANIPVLVATAKELTAEERDWLALRADAFVSKAANSALVLEHLARVLEAPVSSNGDLTQRTIVVVDDLEENLLVMQEIFHGQLMVGCYQGLRSGADLDTWQAHTARPIDLLLLDLQMPHEDGYSILARLRQRPEWAMTKIVALTANVMPQQVEMARAAGFDGFIGKPIEVKRFVRQIPRILSGESVWEPR